MEDIIQYIRISSPSPIIARPLFLLLILVLRRALTTGWWMVQLLVKVVNSQIRCGFGNITKNLVSELLLRISIENC